MSSLDANGLNLLRGLLTVVLMFGFITLVVWLYARKHRDMYEIAAQLPLEDAPRTADKSSSNSKTGEC